jgi:hypothetical protein
LQHLNPNSLTTLSTPAIPSISLLSHPTKKSPFIIYGAETISGDNKEKDKREERGELLVREETIVEEPSDTIGKVVIWEAGMERFYLKIESTN